MEWKRFRTMKSCHVHRKVGKLKKTLSIIITDDESIIFRLSIILVGKNCFYAKSFSTDALEKISDYGEKFCTIILLTEIPEKEAEIKEQLIRDGCTIAEPNKKTPADIVSYIKEKVVH